MTKLCDACDQPLQLVFQKPDGLGEKHPNTVWTSDADEDKTVQYDNVLLLQFDGGYGMFVDDFDEAAKHGHFGPRLLICHECAHEMCAKLPWLDKYIQPVKSHAHTQEYTDAHPEHYGWDYEYAEKGNVEGL